MTLNNIQRELALNKDERIIIHKHGHILHEVYSSEEINARVRQIAEGINARYQGEEVHAVCVLKGAFMFFSDLLKYLKIPVKVDFVRLSSYGMSTESSREIKLTQKAEYDPEGCNVLIVEDIVDTGNSMSFLLQEFTRRKAKSLGIAALLDKPERREQEVNPDFVGFSRAEGFLVGYGLDYAGLYRNLPAIYKLSFIDE